MQDDGFQELVKFYLIQLFKMFLLQALIKGKEKKFKTYCCLITSVCLR